MAGPPSRIEALRRPDKWYLGGGERLLWSPPFPMWLSRPGCWDEVHYFNHALFPVFTWSLLDDSGRPWSLERDRWSWTPAGVTCTLRTTQPILHGAPLAGSESAPAGEVDIFEALAMDPEDWLCAEVTVEADATELLITADAGGSNGPRLRLWKWELQRFANRTGLSITVLHFPPRNQQVEQDRAPPLLLHRHELEG